MQDEEQPPGKHSGPVGAGVSAQGSVQQMVKSTGFGVKCVLQSWLSQIVWPGVRDVPFSPSFSDIVAVLRDQLGELTCAEQ